MARLELKEEDFSPLNLYERLGIEPDATAPEIARAYKSRAKETHPDRHPDDQENATKQFVAVGRAYEILKDPGYKSMYDRQLSQRSGADHTSSYGADKGFRAEPRPDFRSSDFYRDIRYTEEELRRYEEASARLHTGNARSGDLSTVFNHLAGPPPEATHELSGPGSVRRLTHD